MAAYAPDSKWSTFRLRFSYVRGLDRNCNQLCRPALRPNSPYIWRDNGSLETRLDPDKSVPVHRSTIANAARIITVHTMADAVCEVELCDGTSINTGRQYRPSPGLELPGLPRSSDRAKAPHLSRSAISRPTKKA
jgi:hypothetical protein